MYSKFFGMSLIIANSTESKKIGLAGNQNWLPLTMMFPSCTINFDYFTTLPHIPNTMIVSAQ